MSDPYLSLLRAIPADWRVRIAFDVDIHSCRLFPDRHAYTRCVFSVFDGSADLQTELVRPVIHPHLAVPTTPDLIAVAAELVALHIRERGVQEQLPGIDHVDLDAMDARAALALIEAERMAGR